MFYDQLAATIENAGRHQLDECFHQVSRALGAGSLGEDQAQHLFEVIHNRRGSSRPGRSLAASTPAIAPLRFYIQRSPEQRSPDRRASILRRRALADRGMLPTKIGANYTVSEKAVLSIIADECLAHGACDRSLNELAARTGVCRSLAKKTVRLAELDGLITVQRRPRSGRKHLSNIIRIIRAEWLEWLAKGRRKVYAIAACSRAKPDFSLLRGVKNNPPRSQTFRKADGDHVDMSQNKMKRTGASRA